MPKTRKSHPPSLKAKVAVEAIRAHKTAAQIAQMFNRNAGQFLQNRRDFSDGYSRVVMQRMRHSLHARPQAVGRCAKLTGGKIRVPPTHFASALPAAAQFHFVALHYRTRYFLNVGDGCKLGSVRFQFAATVGAARCRHRSRYCFRPPSHRFLPPQERTFARPATG